VEVAGLVGLHSTLPRISKNQNDIRYMSNGMALCCAYGSTNVVYLGIRYQAYKDKSLSLLSMDLEKDRNYI